MAGHTCYHCKQWVEEGEVHDCWTTTESALTADLNDDLRDAWERLRESAAALGEQRIYASHSSIMFACTSCYFFVRPKRSFLEVVVFLGRTVQAPQVKRVVESSKVKRAHVIQIRHRDQVEPPITDWIAEAYEFVNTKRDTKGTKHGTKSTTGGTKNTKKGTTGTKTRTKGTGTAAAKRR